MIRINPIYYNNTFNFKNNRNCSKSSIGNNFNDSININSTIPFKGYMPSLKNKKNIFQIANLIKNPKNKNIIILTHNGPDGDAIGSSIATKRIIKKATGKDAKIVLVDKLCDSFKFMAKDNEINIVRDKNQTLDKKAFFNSIGNADLAIALDVAAVHMFNKDIYQNIVQNAKKVIKIDHHPVGNNPFDKNIYYGNINLVDDSKESAAQIVMEFVEPFKIKPDSEISDPITMGIITDSGNFQFARGAELFEDISQLAKTSNIKNIMQNVNQISINTFKNISSILNNDIKITPDGEIAYFILNTKNLNCSAKDIAYKIFDKISKIKGIKYYFSITQNSNFPNLTASVRSKDISILEKIKELGGGGHNFACGFQSEEQNPEILAQTIINKLSEIK